MGVLLWGPYILRAVSEVERPSATLAARFDLGFYIEVPGLRKLSLVYSNFL